MNFLDHTSMVNKVYSEVLLLMQRIAFFNAIWKKHSTCIHNRVDTLMSNEIWHRECNRLLQFFIQQKKSQTEWIQTVMRKILFIEVPIKKRVVQLYLARQNLLHNVRFVYWLVTEYPERYSREKVSFDDINLSLACRTARNYRAQT